MAIFRVSKNRNYTVMSNYHLKDRALTLKSKGLLSMMLSLPEEWDYTTRGLASICKEGVDAIGASLKELEAGGYLVRRQLRDSRGRITDTEYTIYECPHTPKPDTALPHTENPDMDTPDTVSPCTEKPAELNIDQENKKQSSTDLSNPIHLSRNLRPTGRGTDVMRWDMKQRESWCLKIWNITFCWSVMTGSGWTKS